MCQNDATQIAGFLRKGIRRFPAPFGKGRLPPHVRIFPHAPGIQIFGRPVGFPPFRRPDPEARAGIPEIGKDGRDIRDVPAFAEDSHVFEGIRPCRAPRGAFLDPFGHSSRPRFRTDGFPKSPSDVGQNVENVERVVKISDKSLAEAFFKMKDRDRFR